MSLQSSSSPDHGQVYIHSSPGKSARAKQDKILTIALSVRAQEYPQRFLWAKDNAFALEYTPDPDSPELISGHVKPFINDGIPVRYHCRFFDYELGNADPDEADKAVRIHSRVIDAIEGLGEPVITVHLNLASKILFDSRIAVESLTRLVEHGKKHGITVCLENLRRGPSSDPANILLWAETSGAMITMDIGHTVSSEIVSDGKITVPDIIDLFSDRLREVHMYGKEEDRHYPIENIDRFGPIVDRLLSTDCSWWTIELDDLNEAADTRLRLLNYLNT